MPQNKITPIRLTPEQRLNWDSKLVHKFLNFTPIEQERMIEVYTKFKKNKIGLVNRP